MHKRSIRDGVWWCGAVDWDRRLFDALIPLPDGTSYNAYLVRGTEKTVLIDAVDEGFEHLLDAQLADVPALDAIVCQHTEQDHSAAIPRLLDRYPEARVLASAQARKFLADLLHVSEDRVDAVKDGDTLALGGKTLRFVMTPWVHWPDTMCTFLEEDRLLFSCDFFGSHLATSALYAERTPREHEAAKRYYAQIMMPYAKHAAKNIEKAMALGVEAIAPSHGPVYDKPEWIVDLWREWTSAPPKPLVAIPYVSMHGSTRRMTGRLVAGLAARGIEARVFDLTSVDLGALAMCLVDAAAVAVGCPVALNGLHPLAAHALNLTAALKPKATVFALYGSYGWSAKPLQSIRESAPALEGEWLDPVVCRGLPRPDDEAALDALAEQLAARCRG